MPSDKITCPWCEKSFDLDLLESADLWRERSDLAARLGAQAWKLANEYADSFRSARDARITLKRRIAILSDIARLWEGCIFEYDGRRYKTDQRSILDALQAVCSAAKAGFTNHNYLKRVLMCPAQPERQAKLLSAEGLTAGEEEAREQCRRLGRTPQDADNASLFACPDPAAPAEEDYPLLTPEQAEEHRRKMGKFYQKSAPA